MINYIIVDDEPIAHRIIEGYAASFSYLKKVGNCTDAFEAMELMNQVEVNLIFLDINMPKMKGFDFIKTLTKKPDIIVTTAYSEFAIEGYELNISDYLLKPFSLERFSKSINKIYLKLKTSSTQTHKEVSDSKSPTIFLKGDKKHHQIDISSILFIKAFGNYSKVYFTENFILIHEKISALASLFESHHFLRVHKSYLISKSKIETIEGNQIRINEHKIPIGQTYRLSVNALIGK